MKRLTQKEMATRLGVSQTTVSLVLNDPQTPKVSATSRQRIIRFARKHYRGTVLKQTGTLGFVMSTDPHASRSRAFRTQRYLKAVQGRARSLGLNVLVETDPLRGDFDNWTDRVEGIIVRTSLTPPLLDTLARLGPVVLLNCLVPDYRFDMVMPDNLYGTQNLVCRLVDLGHRRIGFFARRPTEMPLTQHHYYERYEGYLRGLEHCGLPGCDDLVAFPTSRGPWFDHIRQQTLDTLQRWMDLPEPPTAVIGAIDEHALGFLEAADTLGLRVPGDLSVVGFDNIFGSDPGGPSLASVEQDAEDMGALAVQLLKNRIDSPGGSPAHKVLCPTELIERDSLGAAPGVVTTR